MNLVKKMILLLFLLSPLLKAELISNVSLFPPLNACIYNDYYVSNGRFNYHLVDSDTWEVSNNIDTSVIHFGFVYDTTLAVCRLDDFNVLGLTLTDYNFLMALIGLLVGFVFFFFIIYLFVIVGGKRR